MAWLLQVHTPCRTFEHKAHIPLTSHIQPGMSALKTFFFFSGETKGNKQSNIRSWAVLQSKVYD
ncbi:rCG30134 [Rattus norvegicus]|uniref:RCG30134 n=1 Tax=Rattus norvegicus TaxID=10116 RepID=A6IME3_RAT|nr:rCG30134 [Rattus norvegicus]